MGLVAPSRNTALSEFWFRFAYRKRHVLAFRSLSVVLIGFFFVASAFIARAETNAKELPSSITPSGYLIGAGDILQVTVWKEPEMSVPSLVVRPDGKISLPLIKEITAADFTPVDLEHQISKKLALFVKDADVSVLVKEIHSKKIYMVGAVHKTGTISLEYQMTVLQAIAEAGGLTEFAKSRHIYVLRPGKGKEQRILFNYEAVIRGEHMDQNIALLPGDTIVVPN